MDGAEIHTRVVRLVREKVAGAEDADPGSDFVLLGEDGIFDSVTALELVLAIEKEFAIVVKDDEVRQENLGNVESVVSFIQAALSRRAQSVLTLKSTLIILSIIDMMCVI
ncbi:MAG TPA: phosphopantetheine-binding protein [Candidatus Binatia bacterium]|jgi:acyl carrier protein